ncbi:hypothetical protein K491DRAFT_718181 [Lophiostoma macrostomum CBS 122681]|uniref:Uncharacterized protein n=1 Tax=Lophiostoma macrostomum CBS 122681 TaxID=1314788 RepID=A0A6A6SZU6_9PLEO|nr:hypothetical protein K491DRAFT_718181 [Lophiostoma macrostomum CBS 122681]
MATNDVPRDPRLRSRIVSPGSKRTLSNDSHRDTEAGAEMEVESREKPYLLAGPILNSQPSSGGSTDRPASLARFISEGPDPATQSDRQLTDASYSHSSTALPVPTWRNVPQNIENKYTELLFEFQNLQVDYQKVTSENVKLASERASEAKKHAELHDKFKIMTNSHATMTHSHSKRVTEKNDLMAVKSQLLQEIAVHKRELADAKKKLAVMTDQSDRVNTSEIKIAHLEVRVTELETKNFQLETDNGGLRMRNTRLVHEKEQLLAPMRAIDQGTEVKREGERREDRRREKLKSESDRNYRHKRHRNSEHRSSSPRRTYDTFPGRQPPKGPRGDRYIGI